MSSKASMSFLKTTLENPLKAEPHDLVLANGTKLDFLDTGILRIKSAESAEHRIVISCGIHGNETAPIEMIEQLFTEIRAGDLSVKNELLLIIGNPPAANNASRFIEENLNRLFSGKHKGSNNQEAKRAALIEAHVFFQRGW